MGYKTTKTTISIGTLIENPIIMAAKKYLKDEFNNIYNLEPHFNFIIMAMPENKIKNVELVLDSYFRDKKPVLLTLGVLNYESKKRFYSIPVVGNEIMQFHTDLLNILNNERDGYIREKDLVKITGELDNHEQIENIKKYGYQRVLSEFKPHITIGNIEKVDFKEELVTLKLNGMLKDLYNTKIPISKIRVCVYIDAENQADINDVWVKFYNLK